MNDSKQPIRIKLCGMTRPEDAALASDLGADAIGMIFYAKSARNVSLLQAEEIVTAVNPLCGIVAVVVNPEVQQLSEILARIPVSAIQFHGDESPVFCARFQRPYIKAVRMRDGTDLSALRLQYAGARALLLDSFDKNLVGGTGKPFDWSVLDMNLNQTAGPKIMLAGGLTPENVVDAVARTGIANLDVNSGIERAPGIKDPQKMREVMRKLSALSGKFI